MPKWIPAYLIFICAVSIGLPLLNESPETPEILALSFVWSLFVLIAYILVARRIKWALYFLVLLTLPIGVIFLFDRKLGAYLKASKSEGPQLNKPAIDYYRVGLLALEAQFWALPPKKEEPPIADLKPKLSEARSTAGIHPLRNIRPEILRSTKKTDEEDIETKDIIQQAPTGNSTLRDSVLFRVKVFAVVIGILGIGVTLFPPYKWGEEKIAMYSRLTERERRYQSRNYEYIQLLPIKQYDFLFNQDKKDFHLGWGWDERSRRSLYITHVLQRKISTQDLALEYIYDGPQNLDSHLRCKIAADLGDPDEKKAAKNLQHGIQSQGCPGSNQRAANY